MLLSCVFSAMVNGFVKEAAFYTGSITIIFFLQFAIGLIVLFPIVFLYRPISIKTERIGLQILRGIAGGAGTFCLFFAIKMISMTTAVLLVYASPLWMILISYLFLKEHINLRMWIGVIIGFIGIAFILDPRHDNLFSIGTIIAIIGGIIMAFALILIRELKKTEPTRRIVFYYFLVSTLLSFPFFLSEILDKHYSIPLVSWLYILAVGICQALFQIFLVISYQYATPARLAPFIYSIIVFTAIIDFIFWKISFSTIGYIGTFLVIIGGILVTLKAKENVVALD
jgi:drug/metabolite transporter (DMT)-like permease